MKNNIYQGREEEKEKEKDHISNLCIKLRDIKVRQGVMCELNLKVVFKNMQQRGICK